MKGGGAKLRLCPFCGCEQLTIRRGRSITHAWVTCDQCKATGPDVHYTMMGPGFDYLPVEKQIKALEDRAVEYWNMRPPCGNYYPEDLEVVRNEDVR